MSAIAKISEADGFDGENVEFKERLKEIIRDRSFSEGEPQQLASGRTSNFYFNMKMTMSEPEGLYLIAELMLAEIYKEKCDFLGGLEMGAIPVLSAITTRSFSKDKPVPHFWVRKKAKEHGTRKLLEGQHPNELRGKTVIMVDDVTTTGGSVLKAIKEAQSNDITIKTVITIVDRMEGAVEKLREHGITLKYLCNADDFRS
ncbi:MAG: orotate phosphoribosyltransferase [Alphaproteobacteria bacterium]|nr:orotate phosphoribosyltransferase [Alphaproteobacteria bacterium]